MILISGYYGYGNWGDEAVLAAICQDLVASGVPRSAICVLSGDPAKTEQWHQVRAMKRYDFGAIKQALNRSDLCLSGGGSLLQDSTSVRTIPYYLTIMEMAFATKTPVVIYGQGVGPVRCKLYQPWIRRVFHRATKVVLRDAASAALCGQWSIPSSLLTVTADPVFGFQPSPPEFRQEPGIVINLRPYPRWEKQILDWVKFVRFLVSRYGQRVDFVPLGPGDVQMGRRIEQEVPELNIVTCQTWLEAMHQMQKYSACIAMRLHGLVFAALGGTWPMGLNYDPKVAAIAAQMGSPVVQLDQVLLLNEMVKVGDYTTFSRGLRSKVEYLHKKALANRLLLTGVLNHLHIGGVR